MQIGVSLWVGVSGRVAGLILGPMLRYVDASAATVWVETDAACEVEVLGHRARTFHVDGHHYAVVPVSGLVPGSSVEYQVHLDGELQLAGVGFAVSAQPDPDFAVRGQRHGRLGVLSRNRAA